jgi:hypothetical protein
MQTIPNRLNARPSRLLIQLTIGISACNTLNGRLEPGHLLFQPGNVRLVQVEVLGIRVV